MKNKEQTEILKAIDKIHKANPIYDKNAFVFMIHALENASKMLILEEEGSFLKTKNAFEEKSETNSDVYNSIAEKSNIIDHIKYFIIEQFGPMSKFVMNFWGIETFKDILVIVQILVENNIFYIPSIFLNVHINNKQTFSEVFEKPFLPKNSVKNFICKTIDTVNH